MADQRPVNASGSEDEAEVFDWALIGHLLLFVLRSTFRHRRLATACLATALTFTALVLVVFPYKYQADAVLLVRPNPLTGALSTSVNRDLDTPTRFAKESLLNRQNLTALVKDLGLVDRYLQRRPLGVRAKQALMSALGGKEPTREQLAEGMVDTLEDRLWVDVYADTVKIQFQWWDPLLAYEVVQGAMKNFLVVRRASEAKSISEAISILETHRTQLESDIETRVTKVEAQLEKEKGKRAAAWVPAGASTAPDRELARLESTLATRRQAARDLETFRRQRLAQVQAELVQQESMYAPDHPALASTRRVLASLSEPSRQVQEIEAESDGLEEQIRRRRGSPTGAASSSSFADRIERARELYGDLNPRTDYELRQLDQLLEQHGNLMTRIGAARLELETAQAAFDQRYSVIAPPQVPQRTAKPYRMMIALGGLIGGIAFAVFAATVADLRRGLVLERWQIEKGLALPVIGEVEQP